MKIILLIFLSFLLLSSCSIKNAKITEHNKDQILEDATWSSSISAEDMNILISAFLDASFGGEKVNGKTVGQVIEDRKKLVAAQTLRAEGEQKSAEGQADAQEKQKAQLLGPYMNVRLLKKTIVPSNIHEGSFDDSIAVEILFENISNRDIKGFKGKAVYSDFDGKLLAKNVMYYNEVIESGKSIHLNDVMRRASLPADGKTLGSISFDKIVFRWVPVEILFADKK